MMVLMQAGQQWASRRKGKSKICYKTRLEALNSKCAGHVVSLKGEERVSPPSPKRAVMTGIL